MTFSGSRWTQRTCMPWCCSNHRNGPSRVPAGLGADETRTKENCDV